MEIIGFKSFYGRTLFEFPQGITAVVGPNGCGKSNIGDAISWVLGEQRASSLRSDRMEDVIFNGSDARRPLGMAEVSLHFKNVLSAPEQPGGNGHGGNGHPIGEEPEAAGAGEPRDAGIGEAPAAGAEPDVEVIMPIPVAAEAAGRVAGRRPRFLLEEIPEDVVVTRRLYRSGESEYALNGRQVRLKDIQDLLARTQVGTRLYSTIEQGKIEQILASKPKDRRAMFEEAAGILGYKNRRRLAEIKLEATQANLLRIADITAEVEKQINTLKRQAAKARRYRRILETLRERKALIAHRRFLALDGERREAGEALAALRQRDAGAAADRARAEAELERLRLRLEEGEEESRRRREEIHALDMEIDRLQGRLRSGEEQERELAGRLAAAGEELEALTGRASEQEARRNELASAMAGESERARTAEAALDRLEAEARDRTAAIAAGERDLEGARTALVEQLDVLTSLSQRRASVDERLLAARASLERIEREATEANAARAALAGEITRLAAGAAAAGTRLAERVRLRDAALAAERQAVERLAAQERRAEEMKGRTAALGERLASLDQMESQHAGYAEGVRQILAGAAGFAAQGVVGGSLIVPRGLERAVEAALGDHLEAVLVDGPDQALQGVAHLRRNGSGRASFVRRGAGGTGAAETAGGPARHEAPAGRPGVLGFLGGRVGGAAAEGAVGAILGRTVLVEDLALALALHGADPRFAYVTPQGDIVHSDGAVSGGHGPAAQHGILARRAERQDLAAQMEEASRERVAAEEALARLDEERGRAAARLEEAACALRDEERTALEAERVVEVRRADLDRAENTLPLLAGERQRLREEIAARGAEAEDLGTGTGAAETRRREMEESIRCSAEALAGRRVALEALQRQAADAKATVAAGRQRLASLAREAETAEEAVTEVRAQAARRAAERDESTARIEALRGQAAGFRLEVERSSRARAEAAARDEAAHAGLAYDRSLLHAREQAAKQERAAHEAVRQEMQSRELRLARLEADLAHLAATCRDDLGMTLEALCAAPPATEDARTLEEHEAEVESLKADLDGIGPVNLMAIEQHGELEERYGFMRSQTRDIEGSIASLRDTIRTINRQSRARFLQAFQAIQANFQQCFATLFGGGRAELRLQEGEDDVLEAGIEIVAQPPGKRLQSIALLSGGEKALTAVALLFSLFRYRPSPFCVLDEVDAPLDEANVERFTRMLQQLREDTQFILITHNRKSMEAADLLYGVTMEEPGVSKVLPLRFE
jgi:chromosome segregation protein